MNHRCLICILFVLIAYSGSSQHLQTLDSYERHFLRAQQYAETSLFANAIEEANKALNIAKENHRKRKMLEAGIFLAETMRKTRDCHEGISILRELHFSEEFPKLHIDKLGRMAALFNESNLPDDQKEDSAVYYLETAINLTNKHGLIHEKAGLYNELGYLTGHRHADSCLRLLGTAARLFLEEGDTQNHIGARTNMLRTYETIGDSAMVLSTFKELYELTKGKDWYTSERELFVTMSRFYSKQGDTAQAQYWKMKSLQSDLYNIQNISSSKMNSFRALYETERYQNELQQNKEKLTKVEKGRTELILYFTIAIIISLIIALLLLRERKMKKKLGIVNDRYQMLLVESNHRIKNNLQMVISMLNYSSKGSNEETTAAMESMSGKIRTISALHQQLYADIHNEYVNLNDYFSAIIELNNEISSNAFELEKNIDHALIRSERIVYFGLIFNEMLSNTFEHSNASEKRIIISIKQVNDHFHFSYQDFSSFNNENNSGTGIHLIKQLVSRIRGTNFQLEEGTGKYQFDFHAS